VAITMAFPSVLKTLARLTQTSCLVIHRLPLIVVFLVDHSFSPAKRFPSLFKMIGRCGQTSHSIWVLDTTSLRRLVSGSAASLILIQPQTHWFEARTMVLLVEV